MGGASRHEFCRFHFAREYIFFWTRSPINSPPQERFCWLTEREVLSPLSSDVWAQRGLYSGCYTRPRPPEGSIREMVSQFDALNCESKRGVLTLRRRYFLAPGRLYIWAL